jgi:glycosyltransferase involved in cell wall biosynthesis
MAKSMIIGFDAKRVVSNATGLGSYGRTLVNDLARRGELQLRLYAPTAGRDDLRRQVTGSSVTFCYPPSSAVPFYKAYWRTHGLIGQLKKDGVRLFHGLSGELPIGIRKAGIKTVVTIHDLIFMRHPEYYHWIDTKIYEWKFRQVLREADRIVAISACTRRDIAQLGGIDESRIDLIYQSCATRFSELPTAQKAEEVRFRYGLPGRYVLSVGSIEERKNALLALKSLHWLPGDIGLVLVGKTTDYTKRLTEYARQNNLSDRLFLLHGVPDDDLPAIYGRAEVFVYPSRYEGFGIPIIEAIRMGLPVVACTGSCLEEAGGPDSLYVGPDDAEGMAAAIQKLLNGTDEREGRISRSQEYVRRFENNDAAERFASLYEDILPF